MVAALVVTAVVAPDAHADTFTVKGLDVLWRTQVVFGAAWRNAQPQPDLVGAGAATSGEFPGATGAIAVVDDYQLNYLKGELIAAPMTAMSDIRVMKGNSGVFLRVRAWYEMAMNGRKYPHGNPGNVYATGAQLSDDSFVGAGKFQGVDVHDAFFFGDYDIGGPKLHVRLGRQVMSWGEGLIYPGINALNASDYAWVATTGAPAASAGMLPVARAYAGVTFPSGLSVEGFYNLEFRSDVFPGCGTYYSFVDNGFQPGCNIVVAAGAPDQTLSKLALKSYYAGKTYPAGAYPNGGPDHPAASGEPDSGGQFGIAAHQFFAPIKSEVGVYYSKFRSHFPTISMLPGATPLDFAVNNMWAPDQKIYGVSLSTGIRNMALSAQLMQTIDQPAQRNFPEMIRGIFQGIGPYAYRDEPINSFAGTEYPGYYQLNITQLQFGGTAQVGPILGLRNATLTAETAMQFVNNMPANDGYGAERLLRFGNFGYANFDGPNGACTDTLENPQPNGIVNKCELDGYVTAFSMGVKTRFATPLPQFGKGIGLTPVAVFGFDPFGFSAGGEIMGGRMSLAGVLRADIKQRFFAETGFTWFRRSADWDANRDKGIYYTTFGINLQ